MPISNGGVTESYYWTQSLHDVTVSEGSCCKPQTCTHVVWQSGDSRVLACLVVGQVYVDVPKGTRSRDVVCDISATRLKVGLKGSGCVGWPAQQGAGERRHAGLI